MKKYTAIDLFAGGGGLSQGLKDAGFMVSAAVELDLSACSTYSANHPGTILFQNDIRNITGDELLRTSPTGSIDLIAACPPCQGFSSLTSKYRREDPRNDLIFEFIRLVKEIRPKTIMMENVPGLAKGKGRVMFENAIRELRSIGYYLNYDILDVADYGVPQNRRRLVVLGSLSNAPAIPDATHYRNPKNEQNSWRTVRDSIENELEPTILKDSLVNGGPMRFDWNIVRNLSELNRKRLLAAKPGHSRSNFPEELRPSCHKGTDVGFSNVYGRMEWDKPAPTITGGCTTLSKGRFGHPSQLRTISVREAALLQTFPKNYRFDCLHIEKVCNIIGNALPPKFASVMATACIESIKDIYDE